MLKPYFQNETVTIYLGDCRETLPKLSNLIQTTVVTDPVWPNAIPELQGSDRPQELLTKMFDASASIPVVRAAVHLGCDSDPRFLQAVPDILPFFRTTWLRYSCPSKKGRLLCGSDRRRLSHDN